MGCVSFGEGSKSIIWTFKTIAFAVLKCYASCYCIHGIELVQAYLASLLFNTVFKTLV